MFSYIESLFSDPRATIMFFLLALPARVMALSIHEWAHAWMADRCGDPTARMLGRMTLNPAKHLDLVGTLMMAFVGFGWARPVPVNPRNYKNPRRDDILVSLVGITMNLALFLASYIVCVVLCLLALSRLPEYASVLLAGDEMCITEYMGMRVLLNGNTYFPIAELLKNAPFMSDYLIEPVFGRMASYVFEMLQYFVTVNICLAIFNLIPVPPLDGSHVLHNLLPNSPYSNPRVRQIAYFALLALLISNVGSRMLGTLCNGAIEGVGTAIYALIHLIGIA